MMTQGEIEALTITMEKAAAQLEIDIMKDIVRRIKANAGMTSTAEYQINRLRQLGFSDAYIQEQIQIYLRVSTQEMNRIFNDVAENQYEKFGTMYEDAGIVQKPFGEHAAMQAVISSALTQTGDTFKNISQSLGFAVQKNGKTEFLLVAEYYQQTLDNAILGIATGAFDYNSVLKKAVKEMTGSGLRYVDYASGRTYRIESASRTALMTGFSQITRYMNEQVAAELGTDDYEVSYHMGARPTHQWWQGRVYSYQELLYTCGLGTVTGLCGINCYHWYEPFIRGVSVRNYTDEELDSMVAEENKPKLYRGKEYTTYTALQKQRKMELTMRKQRQDIVLLKEGGGNQLDILAAKTRYRVTMNEYVSFSKAMDMPQQMERVYMDGLGKVTGKSVANIRGSGIIKEKGSTLKMDLQFFVEKDIANQESGSLKRAIRKYEKRIRDHEDYLEHPEEHCSDWAEKNKWEQEGLKRHWEKEIRNFKQSIQDRVDELKARGDYDD